MDDAVVSGRFTRRRISGWFRRPLIVGLVAALFVGFAAWVVYGSSWLGVRSVRVEGESFLTPDQIERAAAIDSGTPLARLDLAAVEERVSRLPAVDEVDVQRDWPDGVRIVVRERVAVAVVRQDGEHWAMDAEGVLFRSYREPPRRLPMVRADELDAEGREDALREVAGVVGALDPGIARRVDHVEVASMDAIELVLASGDEVRWGSAAQSDLKARVLATLLEVDASVYDVSVPEQPTTRA
jgi:cell division septal protein FtsQ